MKAIPNNNPERSRKHGNELWLQPGNPGELENILGAGEPGPAVEADEAMLASPQASLPKDVLFPLVHAQHRPGGTANRTMLASPQESLPKRLFVKFMRRLKPRKR